MTTDPPDLADPWPPLPDDGDADTAEWTPRPDVDDWTVQQAAEASRDRALELAVQTVDVVDATSGLVPETVDVVLDTAEKYLEWIETGRRPGEAAMGGTE